MPHLKLSLNCKALLIQVFIEYGARLFFINSPSSHTAKANPTSAKTNSAGGGGGGGGAIGGAGYNSGGGGWSRRAADAALAEAAHADKMMRSAAGSAYRSTCQTPPAQMGRCHMRDVFRGMFLLWLPNSSDLVTSTNKVFKPRIDLVLENLVF